MELFHKYESYRKELPAFLDEQLSVVLKEPIAITKFFKQSMVNYDLTDLKFQPPELQRINWIANCVKHYDGFPLKNNPPSAYTNVDQAIQLQIGQEQFEKDIEFMMHYFVELFTVSLYAGYIEYGLKKAERSTALSAAQLKEAGAQLKTALMVKLMQLTGKFTEPVTT